MIKILFILDEMKLAGAQHHLQGAISQLNSRCFQSQLITLDELGIHKIYGFSGIRGLFRLFKLMKRGRFDIVHSYLFSENILGCIAAKIARVPVIITSRRDTGMLREGKWYHIFAYRITNRLVTKIVCVSEAVKNVVLKREKLNFLKLEVIYNGTNINEFGNVIKVDKNEFKSSFAIHKDEYVIGMIANFSWLKGHKDFIKMAEIVLKEIPETKFLLIGDGPLINDSDALVKKLNLLNNILFLGPRTDIPELLSIMNISVNASYSEGMSNTILESMAAGIPVVATAVDGNLETVVDGQTGILVPPKNPQKMAEAIIKLLKNRELVMKMGENARKLVEEKFTSEIMVRKMEDLYKRLLKPKVAFVLSQFPETHETFILREFKALKEKGIDFEIFSLKPCKDKVIHPEAKELMKNTIYGRAFSLWSIAYCLRHPIKSFGALFYVLTTYFNRPKELIKALYVLFESFSFARIMTKRRVKHIHSHWATMPTTAAMILHKLTGLPFSFTAHAWDIFVSQNGINEKIKEAAFVVTCTDYNRVFLSKLCNNGKSDKIRLNYHGIDLNKFQPTNSEQRATNSRLHILAIGRLVEQKGFEYLIKACGLLRKRGVDFECNIVGTGPLERKLKEFAMSYELQHKINFLGVKTQDEIRQLFNTADCLAQPSVLAKNGDRDGIPNVILESLALGVPVIASDISGIPEAVINEKTGILLSPNDELALADAIERIWENKNFAETLSLNGRRLIEEKFDVAKNTQDLIRIFTENGVLN